MFFVERTFLTVYPNEKAAMAWEKVQILCKHEPEDKNYVRWTFNNGPLPPNTQFIVSPSDHTLTIYPFSVSNIGTYRCEVDDIRNQITFYDKISLSLASSIDEKYMIERSSFYISTDLSRKFPVKKTFIMYLCYM